MLLRQTFRLARNLAQAYQLAVGGSQAPHQGRPVARLGFADLAERATLSLARD